MLRSAALDNLIQITRKYLYTRPDFSGLSKIVTAFLSVSTLFKTLDLVVFTNTCFPEILTTNKLFPYNVQFSE